MNLSLLLLYNKIEKLTYNDAWVEIPMPDIISFDYKTILNGPLSNNDSKTLKDDFDKPTIGILLCKNKDDFEVEFAIKKINSPIGVSEFKYSQINDNNNNEFKNDLENKLKSEFTKELTSELKRIVKK